MPTDEDDADDADDPLNVLLSDLGTTIDDIYSALADKGIAVDYASSSVTVNGIARIAVLHEEKGRAITVLQEANLIHDEPVTAEALEDADKYEDAMFINPHHTYEGKEYLPPADADIQLTRAIATLPGVQETPIITKHFASSGRAYWLMKTCDPATAQAIIAHKNTIVIPDGPAWRVTESAYNDNKYVAVRGESRALEIVTNPELERAIRRAGLPAPARIRRPIANRATNTKRTFAYFKYRKEDIIQVRDRVLGATIPLRGQELKFDDDINTNTYSRAATNQKATTQATPTK